MAMSENSRSSGNGSFTGLFIVAVAVWLLFFGGMDAVKIWTQAQATSGVPVVATIQEGAQRLIATPVVAVAPAPISIATLPTAAVAVPPAPAANVQVIPQGKPQIATATPLPPTAVPTAVSAEVKAVYDSLYVKPTTIPLQACEVGKETYITTPVKVMNVKGFPVGEVRGRSCVSDQEAHDNATKLSNELVDKDKVLHPENWK